MNEEKQKDILKWIIIGLAAFVIIVLIFGAGMFVGGMKAQFSYRWAENYHKNFAGPRNGFMMGGPGGMPFALPGDFIEGHGTVGSIMKIEGNTLTIKGQGNVEKVVLVSDKTIFKSGMQDIKLSDLKVDDWVVIIGNPNDQGQIEARLIRLFNEKDGFNRINFYHENT